MQVCLVNTAVMYKDTQREYAKYICRNVKPCLTVQIGGSNIAVDYLPQPSLLEQLVTKFLYCYLRHYFDRFSYSSSYSPIDQQFGLVVLG